MILSNAFRHLTSLAIVGFTSIVSAENASFKLHDYVAQQRLSANVPCLAVAVIKDGKLKAQAVSGFANLEWQNACTSHSRFQLASTTKLFTGLLLQRLQQQGLLNLNAPIEAYIENAPAGFGNITLRQLASHSAGLPEPETKSLSENPGAYVGWLMRNADKIAPGKEVRYGLGSYLLLRHIIERVTNVSFELALQQWVLSPLKMSETTFDTFTEKDGLLGRNIMPERVARYRFSDSFQIAEADFPAAANPAGGLFASMNDMIKFAISIQTEREKLSELWTDVNLAHGRESGYGIGWTIRRLAGQIVTGHSGGPGLADFLYIPQQQITVVVLSNSMDLYPFVAGYVARQFIEQQPPEHDNLKQDPSELGRWFLQTLNQLTTENIDDSFIADAVKPFFSAAAIHYFSPMLKTFGQVALVAREENNNSLDSGKIFFTSVHGKHQILWSIKLDEKGKVLGFGPESP